MAGVTFDPSKAASMWDAEATGKAAGDAASGAVSLGAEGLSRLGSFTSDIGRGALGWAQGDTETEYLKDDTGAFARDAEGNLIKEAAPGQSWGHWGGEKLSEGIGAIGGLFDFTETPTTDKQGDDSKKNTNKPYMTSERPEQPLTGPGGMPISDAEDLPSAGEYFSNVYDELSGGLGDMWNTVSNAPLFSSGTGEGYFDKDPAKTTPYIDPKIPHKPGTVASAAGGGGLLSNIFSSKNPTDDKSWIGYSGTSFDDKSDLSTAGEYASNVYDRVKGGLGQMASTISESAGRGMDAISNLNSGEGVNKINPTPNYMQKQIELQNQSRAARKLGYKSIDDVPWYVDVEDELRRKSERDWMSEGWGNFMDSSSEWINKNIMNQQGKP